MSTDVCLIVKSCKQQQQPKHQQQLPWSLLDSLWHVHKIEHTLLFVLTICAIKLNESRFYKCDKHDHHWPNITKPTDLHNSRGFYIKFMSNRIYHDLVAMVVTVGWWFYFLFYSSKNKTHNDDASNWNIDFQVVDLHFLWCFYHFFAMNSVHWMLFIEVDLIIKWFLSGYTSRSEDAGYILKVLNIQKNHFV